MIHFRSALAVGVISAAVVAIGSRVSRPARIETSRSRSEERRLVPPRNAPSRSRNEVAGPTFTEILGRLAPGADESDIAALISVLAECRDRMLVLRMIAALPDAAMRAYVVNRLVETWARADPVATAAWLDALPASIDTALAQVTCHRIWAELDAPAAIRHALAMEKTSARSDPLTVAISTWIRTDAAAASAWLATQPPDPVLDRAAVELARSDLMAGQPDVAVSWAQRISNDGQRLQSLESFFARWLDTDRFAARQYIGRSALLSEHDRSELRESLRIVED